MSLSIGKDLCGKISLTLIFCLVFGVGLSLAATIYVPDDYAKIQWAVGNATEGDRIVVSDGVYYENVNIDKQLTIKSENGSANCIVQAADSGDDVFEITADYTSVIGFTVKGASGENKAGIHLSNASWCNLSDNRVLNNSYGIYLSHSDSNVLEQHSTGK